MPRKGYPSETQDQFVVRFPAGVRERIKLAAEKNGRSMNSEILARIDESFVNDQSDLYQMVAEIHAAVKPNSRLRFRHPLLANEDARGEDDRFRGAWDGFVEALSRVRG